MLYMFTLENPELLSEAVIQFVTGSPTLPVLGLPNDIKVIFVHGCKPSQLTPTSPLKDCACLPTVSTCDLQLNVPVHIKDEEGMKKAFITATIDGRCFGTL